MYQQPCIFGLKQKIAEAKQALAVAKALEKQYDQAIVEINSDDDDVPQYPPEFYMDSQPIPDPTALEPEESEGEDRPLTFEEKEECKARLKNRIAELKAAKLSAPLFGLKNLSFSMRFN